MKHTVTHIFIHYLFHLPVSPEAAPSPSLTSLGPVCYEEEALSCLMISGLFLGLQPGASSPST